MHPPNTIGDYAVIGDGRSTALVGRDGSIDWLCWPRCDSPSLFGAILDPSAGRWRVAPVGSFRATRRYLPDTNVLEARFDTAAGALVVTDLMPVADEDEKHRLLLPEREILRLIRCDRGDVELEMVFDPRPGYGLTARRLQSAGRLGVRLPTEAGLLALRTDLPLTIEPDGIARARARLRAGEVAHASLTFASEAPAVYPPLGEWSHAALDRTVRWWRRWASQIRYDGPRRDAVVRSALALKLMVYAPSGAVVAAPTTSLPERIGGSLNWDYRFCWLRDASLTVRALFGIGYSDEGHAFVDWLLQATRLTQPELRVLYDVHGNRPPPERRLDRLAGFRGSRPVRIGNAAKDQRQLDVYGEVIDAVTHFIKKGGTLDRATEGLLVELGEYVCRNWDQPDEGIWEPRSGRADHTHSRVLCWAALDRLLQLHDQGHLRHAPAARFREHRNAIRSQVERRAWNPTLGSYVSWLDGDDVDADLLLMAWYGFEAPESERMRGTYRRVRERLGAGPLLYRYRTDESPGEGAFGVCCFWAVEYLAMGGGTVDQARELFERLCDYGNDVGLFGEEIDPETGAVLGNFPQAFTHVGLISAALTLAKRMAGEPPVERRVPAKPAETGAQETRV
ncbi:MAG TPA: glycoside hydrolase family 15 protein [Gemmatimonadales bacterium]|nr:glycoside hydrolase family 15 protein [Gemmatimonadales bacterium]